jgi:hypothetical protein
MTGRGSDEFKRRLEGKGTIMRLFCILAILAGIACPSNGQLLISVSTDKEVYGYQDHIAVTVTASNLGDVPITLEFGSSCQADYQIDAIDYMHNDSLSIMCMAVLTSAVVPPHDSIQWSNWLYTLTGEWLGVGTHAVVGKIFGYGWSAPLAITVTGTTDAGVPAAVPAAYALSDNYPNPFNPSTTIAYALPARSEVSLKVYSVLGREVATLADGVDGPGERSVVFDAASLPSGVYFCRLEAGGMRFVKKLVLMR